MLYSRYFTVFLLVGIMLVAVFPINAQDAPPNPLITADNINQLTEISRLGRGRVTDVGWSPDGELLAIGGGAGVWLYSSDYEEMALLAGSVQDVYWLSDSRHLLTVNFRTLRLWDSQSGEILTTVELEGSALRDVAISPDGTRLAIAGGRAIRLFDLETFELIHQFEGHSGSVNGVLWLSDSELLSADSHGNLVRWDAETGAALDNQELDTGIETIRLSPTASLLAIGFTNGATRLIDMQSNASVIGTEPTVDLLVEIAWSPDGTQLATARISGHVQIWNAESGQLAAEIEAFPEEGRANQFDIAWTIESDRLVVATEVEVALFDAESGFYIRLIDQFSIDSMAVNWSPDSRYMEATWFAPPPNDKIAVWDVASSQMVALVEHAGFGMWLADSRSFIYLDQTGQPVLFKEWRLDGEATPTVGNITGMSRVIVSPDGTHYVAWDVLGTIQIQNIPDGSQVTIENEHPPFIVAWSPQSTYFLAVGAGTLGLWDVSTGEPVQTIETTANMDFAFSPDETRLAISNSEDQFEVWDIQSGELLQTVQTPYQFRFLDWSPNGDLLLISHVAGMSFWSTETWEEVFNFESSGRGVWSPDGSMIATPGSDGIIRIWGIPTP